jgi:hypothetical protein
MPVEAARHEGPRKVHDQERLRLFSDLRQISSNQMNTMEAIYRVISATLHRKTRRADIPIDQPDTRKVARVRFDSYEFKKKGVSRFDLRDPYHLAISLT